MTIPSNPPPEQSAEPTTGPMSRRSVLERATAVIVGAVIGFVPLAVGLFSFMDPLRKDRKKPNDPPAGPLAGDGNWVQVATLAQIPADGAPQRFQVKTDSWDAWNYYPPHAVGAVFLRRVGSNKPDCWTARCPHLGCSVKFEPSLNHYQCPCHDSLFDADGKLIGGVSPRGMDDLTVEVREGDQVWVNFQKFKTGHAEKIAQP